MRLGARQRWGTAAVCGVWVAVFGWGVPLAALVAAPMTVLGVALLPRRPRWGVGVILLAAGAALVLGATWGQVDMMLPLALALFTCGRTEATLIPGPFVIAVAALSGAARGGVSVEKLAILVPICVGMWVFGVLVRQRAIRAYRAVAVAERLAREDPTALAERLAGEDRERLATESISALRAAVLTMQAGARRALGSPTPHSTGEVHDRGVAAVDELRGLLDLLRDSSASRVGRSRLASVREAGNPTRRPPRWESGPTRLAPTVAFALLLLTALALAPHEVRTLGLILLYAGTAIAVGVSRLSPFWACVLAALASLGAAFLPPASSNALLPIAVGYAVIAWSATVRASARHWWGLAALVASGLALSFSYGHEGSGFVLLVFVMAVLGGVAWREQDRIRRGATIRSTHLQSQLDHAAEAAMREERLVLARELHDVASHTVGAMLMQAGAAGALVRQAPDEARVALQTVIETADRALDDVEILRRVLGGSTGRTEGFGSVREAGKLDERLHRLVAEARAGGVDVRADFDLDGSGAGWSDPVTEAVYHVVQEGLTNARRHGPGASIAVTVGHDGDWLRVRVRNGTPPAAGIPGVSARHGTGHGIAGLSERVEACDGRLSAGVVPHGGFIVEARLPMAPSEDGGASS